MSEAVTVSWKPIANDEAVTVPSLMMVPSIVCEESLAREIHTDTHRNRQTDRQTGRLLAIVYGS